jgi:hypothetical protein
MGRFMQTLRLATAATSVERMVWLGEPSMIRVQPQEARPQVEDIGDTWWRRVVTLTPDHLPGLRRLAAMVDRLDPAAAKKKKGAWLVPPLAGRPGRIVRHGARGDALARTSSDAYTTVRLYSPRSEDAHATCRVASERPITLETLDMALRQTGDANNRLSRH